MQIIDALHQRARTSTSRQIALPEACDPRILVAAGRAVEQGLAVPVLIGERSAIIEAAERCNVSLADMQLVEPDSRCQDDALVAHARQRPAGRAVTAEQAQKALSNPLALAMALCGSGRVDAVVAGVEHTTATVVGQASRYIPLDTDIALLSSCFLMGLERNPSGLEAMIMADCGLVIEPDLDALVDIASAAGNSARALLDERPRVAFLSFSTGGSARHPAARRMRDAADQLSARHPDWQIVGEVQLDAAVDPTVLRHKAAALEPLDGPANVLIFPDLGAGNIAYKLLQRFAGARPIGPVLQGLSRPANDLSRGAGVEEILDIIALSAVQAARNDSRP